MFTSFSDSALWHSNFRLRPYSHFFVLLNSSFCSYQNFSRAVDVSIIDVDLFLLLFFFSLLFHCLLFHMRLFMCALDMLLMKATYLLTYLFNSSLPLWRPQILVRKYLYSFFLGNSSDKSLVFICSADAIAKLSLVLVSHQLDPGDIQAWWRWRCQQNIVDLLWQSLRGRSAVWNKDVARESGKGNERKREIYRKERVAYIQPQNCFSRQQHLASHRQ